MFVCVFWSAHLDAKVQHDSLNKIVADYLKLLKREVYFGQSWFSATRHFINTIMVTIIISMLIIIYKDSRLPC